MLAWHPGLKACFRSQGNPLHEPEHSSRRLRTAKEKKFENLNFKSRQVGAGLKFCCRGEKVPDVLSHLIYPETAFEQARRTALLARRYLEDEP
jgi:hypothetical protein